MSESYVNQIQLLGRVSSVGEERELPSGDRVHTWRLVVPRAPGVSTSGPKGANRSDVIDVSCWSARTRRVAGRLAEGDLVAVEGALRRRFFRTAAGVASRYEVEAQAMRKA
jgi:single-strand DNA-binding protein